jgi:hypothetical protein
MGQEDVLKTIFNAKNLDFGKKQAIGSAISETRSAAAKAGLNERLFGGTTNPVTKEVQASEGAENENTPFFQRNASTFTDKEIAELHLINPQYAKLAYDMRKEARENQRLESKEEKEELKLEHDIRREQLGDLRYEAETADKKTKPFFEKVEKIRETILPKENALAIMQNAIKDKTTIENVGDILSDITGLPWLRSAKGSQLAFANKEFLLKNLQSITGPKNQYIEKQIAGQLPAFGQSEYSNSVIARAFVDEVALDREQVRLTDELSKEDEEKFGYVKPDISRRVHQKLEDFAKKKEDRLAYDFSELYEKYHGYNIKKRAEAGAILTVGMAQHLLDHYKGNEKLARKHAEDRGYKILPDEFYEGIE